MSWNTTWGAAVSAPPIPSGTAPLPAAPPLPDAPPPPAGEPSSSTTTTSTTTTPLIGPVLPSAVSQAPVSMIPPQSSSGIVSQNDPNNPYAQYTAAQYAALTPEQQYALQQHWQQWQAYQQEYAKWHAQYGEQYKREMAAAAGSAAVSAYPSYQNYTAAPFHTIPPVTTYPPPLQQQPPHLQQQPPPLHQQPPPMQQQPPLPLPETNMYQHPPPMIQQPLGMIQHSQTNTKISGQPQMYSQPPPPPPHQKPPPPHQQPPSQHQQPVQSQQHSHHQPNQPHQQSTQLHQQPPPLLQPSQLQGPPPLISGQQNQVYPNQTQWQHPPPNFQNNSNPNMNQNPFGPPKSGNNNSLAMNFGPGNNNSNQSKQYDENNRGIDSSNRNRTNNNRNSMGDNRQNNQRSNDSNEGNSRPNQNQAGPSGSSNPWGNKQNQGNNGPPNQWGNGQNRGSWGESQCGPDSQNQWGNNQNRNDNFNSNQGGQWNNNRNQGNPNWTNQRIDNKAGPNRGNQWGSNKNRGNFGGNDDNFDRRDNQRGRNFNQMPPDNCVTNQGAKNQQLKAAELDEQAFDRQFKQWEQQFEDWKQANANHPDREMYKRYEQEFEKQRTRIMERREQMRRRKMEHMGGQPTHQLPKTNIGSFNTDSRSQNDVTTLQDKQKIQTQNDTKGNNREANVGPKSFQPSNEFNRQNKNGNRQGESPNVWQGTNRQNQGEQSQTSTRQKNQNDDIHENKMESFETESLSNQDDEPSKCSNNEMPKEQSSPNSGKTGFLGKRKSRFGGPVSDQKSKESSEIIALDDDEETGEKSKAPMSEIFKKSDGIPGLDLVEEGSANPNSTPEVINLDDKDGPTRPPKVAAFSKTKKIPSLFDIVVEKPNMSPPKISESVTESPKASEVSSDARTASPHENRVMTSQVPSPAPTQPSHNTPSKSNDIPDISNALQDPHLMQLISEALAKAQGKNPSEITGPPPEHFLEQLPSLLQQTMQQKNESVNSNASYSENSNDDDGRPMSFAEWQRKQKERQRPQQPPNNRPSENVDKNFGSLNKDGPGFGGNNNNFDNNERNMNRGPNNFGNAPGNPPNFGGNRTNCGRNDGMGPNFGGNVPNSPMFGGNGPNFEMNGPNFGFGRNAPNFGRSDPHFPGPNGPNFNGPNGPNMGRNNPNFGGNMNNGPDFGGNRPNFRGNNSGMPRFPGRGGPNVGRFGGNGPNFGRNGPNFGGNGPNFGGNGPNCGGIIPNFGGNGPNCGGNGPNMSDNMNFIGGNNSDDNNRSMDQRGRNPFRRGGPDVPVMDADGFRKDIGPGAGTRSGSQEAASWTKGQRPNSKKDGCGNFFRPVQVIDYQNGSTPSKVIDYGHGPTPGSINPAAMCNQESDFKPIKTFDYGHSSNVQNKNRGDFIRQGPAINATGGRNKKKKKNKNKGNANSKANEQLENSCNQTNQDQNVQEVKETENQKEEDENTSSANNTENTMSETESENKQKHNDKPDLEEISDTEENLQNDTLDAESPPPPPPPMYSSDKPFSQVNIHSESSSTPTSIFPSTAEANENIQTSSGEHVQMVFPSVENRNTITIDEILLKPGRLSRPKKICMILRGPPGSGKSHVAKLIKEKEVEMGGSSPRILSIDDYFLIENDYEEKCPKTGRKIPKKEILYEYDKDMEETYMQYLIKSFKKTIADQLYDFIIIDCNNNSLRTLNEFYCHAKDSGFMPYIIDLLCDLETCLSTNIHQRSEEDIKMIIETHKPTPFHYIKLDVSTLLDNVVEMEDASDMVTEENPPVDKIDSSNDPAIDNKEETSGNTEGEDSNEAEEVSCGFLKSKWETDASSENLARLDGINKPIVKRNTATMEDFLQIDDWEPPKTSSNGKKRVRWADIEEKRAQDKMRAIGFVVGQTDWKRMMDPNAGNRALNQTKYIERVNKRR